MKEVKLAQNRVALVDDEDYDRVRGRRWCVQKDRWMEYAYCSERIGQTKRYRRLLMHRVILGARKGYHVDHLNHNGLDNRKENLRECTASENAQNRSHIQRNNTTGYIGVSWNKQREKYTAYIQVNKRTKVIGVFDAPEEAARARDDAAKARYGEYILLNFPDTKISENSSCTTGKTI